MKALQSFTALLVSLSMIAIPFAPTPALAAHSKRIKKPRKAEFVPGELIVKYKNGTDVTTRDAMSNRSGRKKMRTLARSMIHQIQLRSDETVESAMAAYQDDPDVESVQPNYIYHALAAPNDPLYSQQWGLKNSGQTILQANSFDTIDSTNNPGTAAKDMGLEAAWNSITDCSAITVAVIDTGINYNHGDLAANMWNGGVTYPNHGYNFVDNNNDPMDYNGHGTHVAGTIGAVGNNSTGGSGVCWNVKLMAVRSLDHTGSGTTVQIAQGINFAVAQGAKVINMSLGTGSFDSTLNTAVTNANNAGVIIVAAAGNDGTNNETTPTYPCNFTQANVICVAALTQTYALASFSNYGSTSVDVGAPGTNILSSWAGNQTTIAETFNTAGSLNWTASTTTSGGWAYASKTLMSGGVPKVFDMLVDQSNWNGTNTFNTNTDDKAYKTYNINAADTASLEFSAFVDTNTNVDFFKVYMAPGGGNPIPGGTLLDTLTGSTKVNGTLTTEFFSYDITSCTTATCSIGFQLQTGATGGKTGVGIINFALSLLTVDNTHYNIIEGTSMASPHVAGLAALVWAFNPSFTMAETIAAITTTGTATASLSGKTTTGKAVQALGAISYIPAPTGVSAVKN